LVEHFYIDLEAKRIEALTPSPAFGWLLQGAIRRSPCSNVLLVSPEELEQAKVCTWWRRGRIELPVQRGAHQRFYRRIRRWFSSGGPSPARHHRTQPISLRRSVSASDRRTPTDRRCSTARRGEACGQRHRLLRRRERMKIRRLFGLPPVLRGSGTSSCTSDQRLPVEPFRPHYRSVYHPTLLTSAPRAPAPPAADAAHRRASTPAPGSRRRAASPRDGRPAGPASEPRNRRRAATPGHDVTPSAQVVGTQVHLRRGASSGSRCDPCGGGCKIVSPWSARSATARQAESPRWQSLIPSSPPGELRASRLCVAFCATTRCFSHISSPER